MKPRKVSSMMKKRVAASQRWTCAQCKKMLEATFEVDHIVPHAVGGSDLPSNLHALCVSCHANKTMCEHARIYAFKKQSEEVVASASKSIAVCWYCHSVYSTFFTHDLEHGCDNMGEDALYDSTRCVADSDDDADADAYAEK